MKSKYFIILLIVLFSLSSYVLPKEKNVIYSGINIAPETLDPAQAWDDVSIFFTYNIFDTLVRLDAKTSEIKPGLATNWEIKEQGKVWIFYLKEGVQFHDGTDFDSNAVLFSFKRQMDKEFPYRYYDFVMFEEIFSKLRDIKIIDRFTVAFYLTESFYPFLATLTTPSAAIISPLAVKKFQKDFCRNPVGTGPFVFRRWEKDKRIYLIANEKYWRGKSWIDEFITITNPKYEVLHNLFKKEKIDILFSFSISRAVGLKKLKWVNINLSPKFSTSFLAFNLKNKYLKIKNIREALRHLWDKRILKYVFQDYTKAADSMIPPETIGEKALIEPQNFSIEDAKNLLIGENIPDKISLSCPLEDPSNLILQTISLYARNLKKIGIELKIEGLENDDYRKRISQGDYDLTFSGWIADFPDPFSIIFPMFSKNLQNSGFANLADWTDAKIISELNKAAQEESQEKRRNIYQKINQMIYDEVICIPLFHDTSVLIYNNKKINKIYSDFSGNISLFKIEKK